MNKLIIIAVIVAVIIICLVVVLFFLMRKQCAGRIDIYNVADKDNDIAIESIPSDFYLADKFYNPDWLFGPGNGYNFEFTPFNYWKNAELVFKAKGSGIVRIDFLGKYELSAPNSDKLKKIYVEYKDITIYDKIIADKPKILWHNKPFVYSLDVNDGDVITINFKYRLPFLFQIKKNLFFIKI